MNLQHKRDLYSSPIRTFFVVMFIGLVIGCVFSFVILRTPISSHFDKTTLGDIGSILQGIWGSAASLAAGTVAIFLAHQAIRLQKVQMLMSLSDRPEYQTAFKAAIAYGRLKGLLVLMPLTLRHLQRNQGIKTGELVGHLTSNESNTDRSKDLGQEIIGSVFNENNCELVSLLPTMALHSSGGETAQRIIEARFCALRNTDAFLPTLQAALLLVEEVDALCDELWEKTKDYRTYDEYNKGRENNVNTHLPEVAFWFVQQIRPYTTINRNINYDGDTDILQGTVLEGICKTANEYEIYPLRRISLPSALGTNKATFIANYFDTSLYKITNQIKTEIGATNCCEMVHEPIDKEVLKSDKTVIKIVASNWEWELSETIETIKSIDDDNERKARVVLILDQLEGYLDRNNSNTWFNFSEHLLFWIFCRHLNSILSSEIREDAQLPDSFKDYCSDKFRQESSEQIVRTIQDLADENDIEFPEDEIVEISDYLWRILRGNHGQLKADKQEFTTEINKQAFTTIVAELARCPLFERSIYGWMSKQDRVNCRQIPDELKLIGCTYTNSKLETVMNPVALWLLSATKREGKDYSFVWLN